MRRHEHSAAETPHREHRIRRNSRGSSVAMVLPLPILLPAIAVIEAWDVRKLARANLGARTV